MTASIQSLIDTGTKLYLDSVDPKLVKQNLQWGVTGATSNPVIISEIVAAGGFNDSLNKWFGEGRSDSEIAWLLTDKLVSDAQQDFLPVWESTGGNKGWVSFELDPLLEDPDVGLSDTERTERYVQLGTEWADGHRNRMIKVPATAAGLDAVEELASQGVTLNVTLIFSDDQYLAARDAIWRGAQRRQDLTAFKSVYSIFISRIDVYTDDHAPVLSDAAQGMVGILNAKRIWKMNQEFWSSHNTPLDQEIIFASTGTKKPQDAPWKYVEALAGSDIQTNPPATNAAVAEQDIRFERKVDQFPPDEIQSEIDRVVDFGDMQAVLMKEGIDKFVKPQKALLSLIAEKRAVTV